MTVEDARRKIALLRRISTDNGAVAAEVENAHRLEKALMERYAISAQDLRDAQPRTVFHLNWSYWQELLEEYGLKLERFGNRGIAMLGHSKVCIRLDKHEWWVEQRSPGGWQTKLRDRGLNSLRKFLFNNAPRSYTFSKR
jgi:hypothetical protein